MVQNILIHFIFHFISIIYQTNAFTMTMHPIHSPYLNVLPKSFTMKDRHEFIRNISLSRAYHFDKKNTKVSPNTIEYPLSHLHVGYFLVQLNLGTHDPPYAPFVVVDTSSDQTWIQCARCDPCFPTDKLVYAEDSLTYAKLTLDDNRCDPKRSYEGACGFDAYFGKAHAQGFVGTDTFTFSDSFGNRTYFPNIAFGCGVHNNGFDWGEDVGKISGVHGFAVGPRSFITQLDNEIKGRFSYCIPLEVGGTTISFGDSANLTALVNATNVAQIKTINMNPKARYHLFLAAISVEDERLPIPSFIFELDDKNFKTGFFLDPSTPLTMLNTDAYKIFMEAVEKRIKDSPKPIKMNDLTDVCYDHHPKHFPNITFHFTRSPGGGSGEADMIFPNENIFRDTGDKNRGFCLNIAPTDGPSIFGAYQQANHRFLFDINKRELSFVEDKC
ncbi:hypothetical protein RND81_04G199000 [Saponaria officinalis]|uniref:Peptidase A1 domain-containing protein n=1 Tax=Saponaria officinalis TaxID=3572 RepID=A0AAW1LN60_SAPOF